jgi:excisionase family DNA binding protein
VLALITTTEAASRLGVNQSRVRQLILSGQLPGKKYGRDWMVDEDDLSRYQEVRRPVGRPSQMDSGSNSGSD